VVYLTLPDGGQLPILDGTRLDPLHHHQLGSYRRYAAVSKARRTKSEPNIPQLVVWHQQCEQHNWESNEQGDHCHVPYDIRILYPMSAEPW
jgi:hypothetical protein